MPPPKTPDDNAKQAQLTPLVAAIIAILTAAGTGGVVTISAPAKAEVQAMVRTEAQLLKGGIVESVGEKIELQSAKMVKEAVREAVPVLLADHAATVKLLMQRMDRLEAAQDRLEVKLDALLARPARR